METQREIPLLKKNEMLMEKNALPVATSCCAPKRNASACCTPNETPAGNGGVCCPQPADGSACCDK